MVQTHERMKIKHKILKQDRRQKDATESNETRQKQREEE